MATALAMRVRRGPSLLDRLAADPQLTLRTNAGPALADKRVRPCLRVTRSMMVAMVDALVSRARTRLPPGAIPR